MTLLGGSVQGRAASVRPERTPTGDPQRTPGGFAVLESFEDGDISEYGGDTGAASVVSSADIGFPTDGSQYLSFDTGATGGVRMIASTAGLDAYPEQGDTARWDAAVLSDGNIGPVLFAQQEDNSPGGYSFRLDSGSDVIAITREETDGTVQSVTSTSVTIQNGQRYIAEARPKAPDELTMILYDTDLLELARTTGTDATFTSGGLGWRISTALASQVTGYVDDLGVV